MRKSCYLPKPVRTVLESFVRRKITIKSERENTIYAKLGTTGWQHNGLEHEAQCLCSGRKVDEYLNC